MEEFKNERKEQEIVFSKSVKAGKRIYYLDVKRSRNNDLFLAITESKKKFAEDENAPVMYEKHKIFLYKEDFEKFMTGLQQAIQFITDEQGPAEPSFKEKETPTQEEPSEGLSEGEIKIDIDF